MYVSFMLELQLFFGGVAGKFAIEIKITILEFVIKFKSGRVTSFLYGVDGMLYQENGLR